MLRESLVFWVMTTWGPTESRGRRQVFRSNGTNCARPDFDRLSEASEHPRHPSSSLLQPDLSENN
jgi:hypothetical protein